MKTFTALSLGLLAFAFMYFAAEPSRATFTKDQSRIAPDGYVIGHVLAGKPCKMPGRVRYQGECYTAENLKLVKLDVE